MSQTLQAALGDPAVADVVQAGRLHQAVSYGGFGPDDLASAMAASLSVTTKPAVRESKKAAEPEKDDVETRAAAEKAGKARAAADAARAAARGGGDGGRRGHRSRRQLADQVESLRTQLRDTETAEREAREAARAARKHYNELLRDAAAAEQAATRAERA